MATKITQGTMMRFKKSNELCMVVDFMKHKETCITRIIVYTFDQGRHVETISSRLKKA